MTPPPIPSPTSAARPIRGRETTRALTLWALAPVAAFAALAALADRLPPLLLVNESASLPTGLYLRRIDQRLEAGGVVALEPPVAAWRYLSGLGMPSRTALLKRVWATGGERVCAQGATVRTPRGTVPVRARDRRGAPLPAWTGCRRLGAGEVFVLGDTPGSFDSRYFGPVRRSDLRGVYRRVLTW